MTDAGSDSNSEPKEFLTGLSSDLTAQPAYDFDLASILTEHILNASPQSDCVARARRAVSDLAKTRAAPMEKALPDA